jgi:NAD-dependent deacetylase
MFMTTGTLARQLKDAQHVVVFTGAGASAESGIPTFRDALTGLWERFDPAQLATREAFTNDPSLCWRWYEWRRSKVNQARPNGADVAIAELSKHVPKLTVVSQNVDDLHERAGSQDVIHLHGSLHSPRCIDCGLAYQLSTSPQALPEEGRESSHLSAVPETGMFVLEWFGSVICYSRGMAGRAGSCR